MRVRGVMTVAIVFFGILVFAPATYSQAPDEGQVPDQAQVPAKGNGSKAKEFQKIFCAESSVAQRNMMVGAIDCNDVCETVYREYPCDLQQRLSEGWKVTSVSISSIVAQRDPCECKVTGTESVLERN